MGTMISIELNYKSHQAPKISVFIPVIILCLSRAPRPATLKTDERKVEGNSLRRPTPAGVITGEVTRYPVERGLASTLYVSRSP